MGPEPMETKTSNQIEQILLKNKEYHHQCSFEQHIPALHGRRCPAGLSLGRACAQPTSAPHPTVITCEGCDVIAELHQSPYRSFKTATADPNTWGKTPANTLNRLLASPHVFFRAARPSLARFVGPSCAGPCLCKINFCPAPNRIRR